MAIPEWLKQVGVGAYAGFDDFLFGVPDYLWKKYDRKSFEKLKKERQEGKYRVAETVGDMSSILGDILLIPLMGAGVGKIGAKLGAKGVASGAKLGMKGAKIAKSIDKASDTIRGINKAINGAEGIARTGILAGKGAGATYLENVLRTNLATTEEERDAIRSARGLSTLMGAGSGLIGGAIRGFAKKTPLEKADFIANTTREAKIANLNDEFKKQYIKVNNKYKGAKTAKQINEELEELSDLVDGLKKNKKTVEDFKKGLKNEYKQLFKKVENSEGIKKAGGKLKNEFSQIENLFTTSGELKKSITPTQARDVIKNMLGETSADILIGSNIEDRKKILQGISRVKNNLQIGESRIMTLGRDIQSTISDRNLSSKVDGIASDLYAKSESLLSNFDDWKKLNKKYKMASIIEAGELQEAVNNRPRLREQLKSVLAGQELSKAISGAIATSVIAHDDNDTAFDKIMKASIGGLGGVLVSKATSRSFDEVSKLSKKINSGLLNSKLANDIFSNKVGNKLVENLGAAIQNRGGDYFGKINKNKSMNALLESENQTQKSKEEAQKKAVLNSLESFIFRELSISGGTLTDESKARIQMYRDNLLRGINESPDMVGEYYTAGNKDASRLLRVKNILTRLDWNNKDDLMQIKYALKKIGLNEKEIKKHIAELSELGRRQRNKRIKEIIAKSADKSLTPALIALFEGGGI